MSDHRLQEAIERLARRGSVARAQQLDGAVDPARALRGVRLGRCAPHLLEMIARRCRSASARTNASTSPSRATRFAGDDDEHVAQPIAIARARRGIGRGGVEQRERVEHVRVAARLAPKLLEERARLGRPVGQRVDARERESDVGARRVELASAVELLLGVGEASGLEIGVAEVGEAERIVGGELGELL